MKIQDKAVLITGAGRGIGAAMALRFAAESPRGVVVSDIDEIGAQRVAGQVRELGVDALAVGVSRESAVAAADPGRTAKISPARTSPPAAVPANAPAPILGMQDDAAG